MDIEDIAILSDMNLAMTIFLMGKCLSSNKIKTFFHANKDRLRQQKLPEDKINKLTDEMLTATLAIKKIYHG